MGEGDGEVVDRDSVNLSSRCKVLDESSSG